VFFAHQREGRGGREFPCLKFRTMVANAHAMQRDLYKENEVDGPQFKVQHDPRMTRLGRLLRATNIDELPQFINVLLGHMSLVGPRPSPFRENQICVPWRRARLSVRPGITGLWQLCRADDRSRGDFHEWIHFDILYVRNMSIWLDVKIFLATVATLGGKWSLPVSVFVRPAPAQGRAVRAAALN
jgi:lipopolysaccharide/colanic/teichoic acid biosynthesis glycosyltransferase